MNKTLIILSCASFISFAECANWIMSITNKFPQNITLKSTASLNANRVNGEAKWGNEFTIAPNTTVKTTEFIIPWDSAGQYVEISRGKDKTHLDESSTIREISSLPYRSITTDRWFNVTNDGNVTENGEWDLTIASDGIISLKKRS